MTTRQLINKTQMYFSNNKEHSITISPNDENLITIGTNLLTTPDFFHFSRIGFKFNNIHTALYSDIGKISEAFSSIRLPSLPNILHVNNQLLLDDGSGNTAQLGIDGSNNFQVNSSNTIYLNPLNGIVQVNGNIIANNFSNSGSLSTTNYVIFQPNGTANTSTNTYTSFSSAITTLYNANPNGKGIMYIDLFFNNSTTFHIPAGTYQFPAHMTFYGFYNTTSTPTPLFLMDNLGTGDIYFTNCFDIAFENIQFNFYNTNNPVISFTNNNKIFNLSCKGMNCSLTNYSTNKPVVSISCANNVNRNFEVYLYNGGSINVNSGATSFFLMEQVNFQQFAAAQVFCFPFSSLGENVFSNPSKTTLFISSPSCNINSVYFNNGTNFAYTNGAGVIIANGSTSNLLILNSGSGNVSIGANIFPSFKLDVTGTGRFTQQLNAQNGIVVSGKPINLPSFIVSTLPVGVRGDICYVTDALNPSYNQPLTGGSNTVCKAFFNGTNWVAG